MLGIDLVQVSVEELLEQKKLELNLGWAAA